MAAAVLFCQTNIFRPETDRGERDFCNMLAEMPNGKYPYITPDRISCSEAWAY